MAQRKKWSPSEKFKIALLAIKGESTLNDICKQYQVARCCELLGLNRSTLYYEKSLLKLMILIY